MNVWRIFGSIFLNTDDLDKGLDHSEDAAGEAGEGIAKGIEKGTNKAEEHLKRLGGAMQMFGGILTAAVTVPFVAMATAGVKSAMQLETFAASLNVLIGDTERANAVFEELYEFSANVPFDWKSLSEGTRTLAAFGVEAEQIVPTLSMIGDVAAGTQSDLTGLAEIYGRVQVTGRLSMNEVNQLAQRGIPIYTELAKQLGVSEGEVRKLVSTGKIGFPELQRVFQSLTSEGGRFFGMMEAQADTTAGKIARLKDSFEQVTDQIGMMLLPIINKITDALFKATQWFVKLDEDTQKVLITVVAFVAALGPVLLAVGTFLVKLPQLRAQLAAVRIALMGALGPVLLITTAIAALYIAWRTNFLGIQDITKKAGAFVGRVIQSMIQYGASLIRNWETVKFTIATIWESMGRTARAAGELIMGAFDVAGAAIVASFVAAGQAILKVFIDLTNGVVRGLNSLIDMAAPLFEAMGLQISRIPEIASATWGQIAADFSTALDAGRDRMAVAAGDMRAEYRFVAATVATAHDIIVQGMGEVASATEEVGAVGPPAMIDLAESTDEAATAAAKAADEHRKLKRELAADRAMMRYNPFEEWDESIVAAAKAADRLAGRLAYVPTENPFEDWDTSLEAAAEAAEKLYQRRSGGNPFWDWDNELESATKSAAKLSGRLQPIIDLERNPFEEWDEALARVAVTTEKLHQRITGGNPFWDWDDALETAYQTAGKLGARLQPIVDLDRNPFEDWEAAINRATTSAEKLYQRATGGNPFKDWDDSLQSVYDTAEKLAARLEYIPTENPFEAWDESVTRVAETLEKIYQRAAGGNPFQDWDDANEPRRSRRRGPRNDPKDLGEKDYRTHWQKTIDLFVDGLEGAAAAAVPAFSAALEGFATAGPLGALAAVFLQLLTSTESFGQIMEMINGILEPIIGALDSLLQALMPVIQVILNLMTVALMPLVWVLEKVIAPVFTFVGKLIAGIYNAIATAINWALGWLGVKLPLITIGGGGGGAPSPVQPVNPLNPLEPRLPGPGEEEPKQEGEQVGPQYFGGVGQSVQLAVATPLVEASYAMLDAATRMQDIFAPGPMGGFAVLPPFTSAISELTPVLERLLAEGVSINLGPTEPIVPRPSPTAYMRI